MPSKENPRDQLKNLSRELRLLAENSSPWDWAVPGKTPAAPCALPSQAQASLEVSDLQLSRGPEQAGPLAGISWEELQKEVERCRKCPLGSTRLRVAFGVGSVKAEVMFIGEGPGYEEDHKGEPFVGKAGQLLDKILASIGLSRQTVYIANMVKCHPMIDPGDPEKRGNDRPPSSEEMQACRPYLEEQIKRISPKVIVTLGAVPARALLNAPGIRAVRGKWQTYQGIKVLPTYHPAALLRDPDLKKDVWQDMKALKKELSL